MSPVDQALMTTTSTLIVSNDLRNRHEPVLIKPIHPIVQKEELNKAQLKGTLLR